LRRTAGFAAASALPACRQSITDFDTEESTGIAER